MSVEVHWHEGLFLQPHHLQAFGRQVADRVRRDRRLGWGYPWGVVESRLNTDELANMRVRFDRLRVVMPSGIEVDSPGNCDLPSMDIGERFNSSTASFTVSLGVPLWQKERANALEIGESDWRIKRLYRVEERETADENTGENPQGMLVRKVNARLLLEGDDTTDMEVVPLVRVGHAAGEDIGSPRLERTFVPPCMLLSGSSVLREMVRGLANDVEAARGETVVQMTRGGFNLEQMRGVHVQQMIRLQTLNTYAARLIHMARSRCTSSFVACWAVWLRCSPTGMRGMRRTTTTSAPGGCSRCCATGSVPSCGARGPRAGRACVSSSRTGCWWRR